MRLELLRRAVLSCGLIFAACDYSLALAQSTPAVNKPHKTANQQNLKLWNLKDVDIRTFIHSISAEIGKNFVIDPRVNGKVTFISSQALNQDELYQAFLSVLQVNGFVALPDGSVIKVVPDYVAKGLSSPIYNASMRKDGDAMAVSVLGIRYVPANELAGALNQFLTPAGHIASYGPSNDLIVADRAGNIEHLIRLVRQIDQQRSGSIDVIHLHYAQAKFLVDTLKSMLERKGPGQGLSSVADVSLAADERTNSVLLAGGSQEQRSQIRSVIKRLDASNSVPASVTQVIYLKHLHAERAATIVNGLIQNYTQKSKGEGSTASSSSSGQSSQGSSSGGSNSDVSSLFNTSMSGSGSSGGSGSNGPSTMYSSNSGFFSNNSQDNDINSIIGKMPKSGSVSPAVQWEESTNSLVVTAPRDLMRKIMQVITRLDIRRPQVLIEAVIAEVSEQRQKELGIQWNTSGSVQFQTAYLPTMPLSIIGSDGKLATLSGGEDTTGQGISLTKLGNNNIIRLLISALEGDSTSNVLATPNLVTLDNEPAQIKVGEKVPFATGQIQNNPTGGNPFNFFDREDVGLVLTIDPQITPNGAIKLLIQQELSAIIPGPVAAGGNPTTSERFIRTTVMADNGKILVLGGLLENQWNESASQVPWLANIPVLGWLMKDKQKSITKTNLMIFLRPTILYDERDETRVSDGKYEFLRQSQLAVDIDNPYRHHYVTPTMPVEGKEVELPPPFPLLAYKQFRGQG